MGQNHVEGKFIGIFGPNNLGKTTATNNLISLLTQKKFHVTYLKYPVYNLDPTGPQLNDYLRKGNPEKLSAHDAQQMFAQNRRDFEPELLKLLNLNNFVIAEDYSDTGRAWGIANGISLKEMDRLNKGLRVPDLKIYLDGNRFSSSIEDSHLHESNDDMWQKSRKIHLKLAKRSHAPIVNANLSQSKVAKELFSLVKTRFGLY